MPVFLGKPSNVAWLRLCRAESTALVKDTKAGRAAEAASVGALAGGALGSLLMFPHRVLLVVGEAE